MRQLFTGLVLLFIAGVGSMVSPAEAFEEPEHWSQMGTVQQWMDLDTRFYRSMDDNRFVDRSQFRLNQQEQYAQTRMYGGELPAVSIEEFLALDPSEQQLRSQLAAKELAYVERFLRRVQNQVQKVRENLSSGWGDQISDVTVIGDCLTHLGDAIGLDPSNPYAWHLQSYFAFCAGDESRSRQYLEGAGVILGHYPANALKDLHGRVALDLAWLQRSHGEFDLALSNLELAEEKLGRRIETHLLRGLIYAQTGRPAEAGQIAARLRKVDVRHFPSNQKSADFRPELMDPASWSKKSSSYLAAWINALALLREGNREQAFSTFGSFSRNDVYPLGWRFWNEAGMIYEMTGRSGEALHAWNAARIHRPWLRNMVYKPYDLALGVLTGHDAQVPYMLGYDRNFLAGSRLAYGASLVGRAGNAEMPGEKQEWVMKALDELEICRDTGNYPGQASVLRGHAFYLLGDIESTLLELETAVILLEKQGEDKILASVMKDMVAIRQNQQASEMGSLMRQSGNSQGRWEADVDPVQRQGQLEARMKSNPGDDQAILEMARFMIRHDQPRQGKELLQQSETLEDSVERLTLSLEADRLLGETEMALQMVSQLDAGKTGQWKNSGMWSLVGSLCLEQGQEEAALKAFEHALALDPENQGLRMQLRLMGE